MSTTAPETKSFNGDFMLYRKDGKGMKRLPKAEASHPPRRRHKTWAGAEAEAERLLEKWPASTFIVLQEVGRIKLKPAGAPSNDRGD